MEEQVGELWHRFITRAARSGFPQAKVTLQEVEKTAGILFRAGGGDAGLRLEAANAHTRDTRRNWLQRLAGSGQEVALASCDDLALRLPQQLQIFPTPDLNRDAFLWLAALAAQGVVRVDTWLQDNQALSLKVFAQFPGLHERYRKLVQAYLPLRGALDSLPEDERVQETAIRKALLEPGTVDFLPVAGKPVQAVHLWLSPDASISPDSPAPEEDVEDGEHQGGQVHDPQEQRRRDAERVAAPQRDRGLLALRMEAIFGWAEYVKVDRGTDDNEDMEEAVREANDMEVMSVARDSQTLASRVRFDLDLPAASCDDLPLGEGERFPEWDCRRQKLIVDACLLHPLISAQAVATALPEKLRKSALKLRRQFQALMPARVWQRGQPQGVELDLDAYLRYLTDRVSGYVPQGQDWYRDLRGQERDLSCLLLADLSLSTDAYVNDRERVIDVIRDSLYLFSEALSATGDRFSMWGFSSRKRDVRMHCIKKFSETLSDQVRGRIGAIKPGFYTRMGAAIRFATQDLQKENAGKKLLLILTDGKPNDLDQYEGRYGIEDTRMSLHEARKAGLHPFCVTIDDAAGDYLPYLFGSDGYVVIRRPAELPGRLPLLYAQLSR